MPKMGKERLFTTMLKRNTSEEREEKLKHDVQNLNEQVVQKQLVVNKLEKRHVGKAKNVVATILSP
jgi:hypothetical protein